MKNNMKTLLLPEYWKSFVINNDLVGKEVEFPWPDEEDLDAIIEILDDENVELEANELWPGIGIKDDGYFSVAGCSIGTGNQYCINIHDGKNGPLYLVDHERVGPEGYDKKEAISIMLNHYEDLLKFLKN
jgi:hypothetical protein